MLGVGRPDEVISCVEAGVDLFESFFPFQVTERGCALTFNYTIDPDPETAGTSASTGVKKPTVTLLKRYYMFIALVTFQYKKYILIIYSLHYLRCCLFSFLCGVFLYLVDFYSAQWSELTNCRFFAASNKYKNIWSFGNYWSFSIKK